MRVKVIKKKKRDERDKEKEKIYNNGPNDVSAQS